MGDQQLYESELLWISMYPSHVVSHHQVGEHVQKDWEQVHQDLVRGVENVVVDHHQLVEREQVQVRNQHHLQQVIGPHLHEHRSEHKSRQTNHVNACP